MSGICESFFAFQRYPKDFFAGGLWIWLASAIDRSVYYRKEREIEHSFSRASKAKK
jgi:hypothetical protein